MLMEMFVEKSNDPAGRCLGLSIFGLAYYDGGNAAHSGERGEEVRRELPPPRPDLSLQDGVLAKEREIRRGLRVADQELLFGRDQQNGKGGLAPSRPKPITKGVRQPERFA